MGKSLRNKNVCSPIQNQPGFMWGLFGILKHNHWRYIKKRLPHKRLVGRKHDVGLNSEGNNVEPSTDCVSPSTSKNQDNVDVDSGQRSTKPNPVEKLKKPKSGEKSKKHNLKEKSKKHHSEDKSKKHHSEKKSGKTNSEIKKSVKALIKALVSEDKSKRNNRHRRSSTYPVQSNSIEQESLHRLESSDEHSSNEDHTRVFNQAGDISPAIGSLNPLFLMSEESSSDSDECGVEDIPVDADGNGSNVKGRNSKKKKKKERDQDASCDPKSINDEEVTENDDTSPRRSKACLDALNLIHTNRKFLLKVLQDPGSPLAWHFHSEHAFRTKAILAKAGSFPVPGSPHKKDSQPKGHSAFFAKSNSSVGFDRNFTTPSIAAEYRADGIQKLNETMAKVADEDSSGSGYMRKRGKNKVVVKRFKDLRQKIRHVINEHKNERQRITMDAVLDKVPRKHGFSKDLKQDIFNQLKGQSVSRNIREGSKLKSMRRTSSLGGSLDRYVQLYECSFQREAKNQISEKSKPEVEDSVLPARAVPRTLGRILSLPEMKSYSFKIEEPPEKQLGHPATSRTSDEQEQDDLEIPKVAIDQMNVALEREAPENMANDTAKVSSASENQLEPTATSTSKEKGEIDEKLMIDTELHYDQATESATRSSYESSEDSPCLERTFSFHEKALEASISQAEDSESQHDPDTDIDSETESYTNPSMKMERVSINEEVEVDARDKAKFNYVRDILEISGFNTTESLSTWHSYFQPLDPLIYEEVATGCMLQDPECSGYEEGGNCDHLLLFDLINEVLMEIYERSYYYSPMPLSSLCKIHPMPMGYTVLKDVWLRISWYLKSKPQEGELLDHLMSRDLSKGDGWMNLQFDSECVGLEVEDLIFDELLEELLEMD